ncbi:glycosyltransferase family 4 protein [Opitutaceae bacterium]|nr:glycosyltransferase family 4 protein [Opitutaceae bacterium]MDB4473854.1 glycosyltransferase family 4 protein [Opitutaceae bacterium]
MSTSHSDSTIYIFTHEFYPKRGGIATFTEEMARATTELGKDVEVWAQDAGDSPEKKWPFRIRRLALKGTHDLTCLFRLAAQIIKHRRTLREATVCLAEPGPMLAMMILQLFPPFRPRNLLLTFYGSEILRFHRNRFLRPLTRRLIRNASRIGVISKFTENLLFTHFPAAAAKTVRTACALRSDFAIAEHARSTGEPKTKTIVLTVARLHPRKGQTQTMDALKALAPLQRENIEYWIVGSANRPQFELALREHAATCDFPVKFWGEVPDEQLDQIYDQADIFSMTSIAWGKSVEGFGMVYLEAGARGLPVIAHDIGGVSDAVVDQKTGFLVAPIQPTELTAAFEKLINSPELRLEMGHAGRSWATHYRWRDSAQALFDVTTKSSA